MVNVVGISVVFLSSLALLALFKFFHKLWWLPMRIKYSMSSQGIKGPPYRLVSGNTKEISSMREKSASIPMEISHHHIFPRIQPHFHSWFSIYGKNFLYWYGPQAELVVTDPELIVQMMNNKDISATKQDVGAYIKKMVGEGLTTSEGEKWAKQRKLANQAFHAERLKSMVPAMVDSVERMLKRWKEAEAKEIEVCEEFTILTSEVISRSAFGSSYLEGKQVFKMLRQLIAIAGKNLYRNRLPGFSKMFKDKDDVESDKLEKGIRDLIMETIRNREKMITGDEENYGDDFLGLLLKAHHDNREDYQLSMQDIIDDCKTFYTVGHGTTSLLLSWACFLLGVHSEWQERAQEEVLQVFGKENPCPEGITKLKIMGMIIYETLRLYPPAISLIRKVRREVKIGNLVLPANTNVHFPTLALQHDLKLWGKDAHLFKPDRFSEGIAKATNHNPAAYIPFGFGRRSCVGSNFAINEVKIALSMIIQRYRFTLSPKYVHSPVQLIALRPKFGVQIMFHAL